MKNVLLLTTPFRPNVGGVETHLDDLIREGSFHNINFLVLTYQPLVTNATGKSIEYGPNYTVYRIPWIRMNLFLKLEQIPLLEFIYLSPGLFLAGIVLLLLKGKNIQTIHAQGIVAGAVGAVLGMIFRKPVIISTHSIYNFPKNGLYPYFVRYIFKNSRHVLTLSNQSTEEVVALGVSRKKVFQFTYWINQEIFYPRNKNRSREKLNLSKKGFYCLFVGRLVAVKGVNELMSAARITKKGIIYLIVGDGPLAEDIKKESKKSSNIIFAGRVENSKLADYYSAVDLLIVPSIHEEGFGRVILEALSCGLPVVASNRGGIKESLSKNVGVLIDITPEKIKNTVELLFKNKNRLTRLSKKATMYARRNFGLKNAEMIYKHYE